MAKKTCCKCHQTKPLTDEFFQLRETKNGVVTCGWCRECTRVYLREYMAKKRAAPGWKEKCKAVKAKMRTTESGREYLRRNKREDKKRRRCTEKGLPADYRVRDWRAAKSDWGGRCAYCGKECEQTQDHYVPISSKECPGHVAHNIVPACIECNVDKSNKPARAWIGDDAKAATIEDWLLLQIRHDLPLIFY